MSKFDVLDLHYQDDSHSLTTEEEGTITLCITNTGDTDFVFSNPDLLGADQIPGIDTVPEEAAARADTIYFYYDYSDAEQSLTNETRRDSIAVVSTDTQFSVAPDTSPAIQRYFKIFSTGKNAVIAANSSIAFSVKATCSKTPGEAVTIFKYSDDAADHPQRKCFGINKHRKPVIGNFAIDGNNYNENGPAIFRWTVNHIEEFTVRLNDIPVSSGYTSYNLEHIACTDYTLYVTNMAGYVSPKTISPDFGIIFRQETAEGKNAVTLQWDVSRLYYPVVKILRNDTEELYIFSRPSASVVFNNITSDVVFRFDCKIYHRTISVKCPQIIRFDASRNPLSSPREFIPPEEVAKNEHIIVMPPYAAPGPPDPPNPPPYRAYVKWNITGNYCTVNGSRFNDSESSCIIESYSPIVSVELRAYDDYGLYVSQTKTP